VVDEAVAQLLRLADGAALPALDAAAALRLLLDALDAAPPRTAPPLARGVVSAFLLRQRQSAAGGHVGGGSGGAGPAESSELWARHPLSAALLAQPAGAQQLLSHACDSLVAAAAGDEGSKAVVNTWHALRPFFSFILLRPVETYGGAAAAAHAGSVLAAGASGDARGPGSALALRACLVGKLARAACGSAAMARLAVPFLLRHVACTPLADDAVRWGRLGAAQCVAEQCVAALHMLVRIRAHLIDDAGNGAPMQLVLCGTHPRSLHITPGRCLSRHPCALVNPTPLQAAGCIIPE
jgi:hypothetical protein